MNKIIEHQNDQTILDKLSAQRNLYKAAKRWKALRLVLCVILIVVLAMVRVFSPDISWVGIALTSLTFVSLLIGPVLDYIISNKRNLAARIQQLLETELYGLDWNHHLWGSKPSYENVYDHKSSKIPPRLHDWFKVGIGDIQDINTAILLCQRDCLKYDSYLRRRYFQLCIIVAIVFSVCIIVCGAIRQNDWVAFITFSLIPMTPTARWLLSVILDEKNDKKARESLESMVNQEMKNALSGPPVHKTVIIQIQELLFTHRNAGYLVPEWLYKLFRKKLEARSAYSIDEFLAKYKEVQK
ncbi:MAG: hypothetical protein J6S97_09360 [Bacteroidales bacterium]|nr:hypothetical protein [Bacteroidales bacterium]